MTLSDLLLEPGDKLVRVKSWRPSRGPHGIEWPTMLIDTRIGQRETVTPVWDKVRVRMLFRRALGKPNHEEGK